MPATARGSPEPYSKWYRGDEEVVGLETFSATSAPAQRDGTLRLSARSLHLPHNHFGPLKISMYLKRNQRQRDLPIRVWRILKGLA